MKEFSNIDDILDFAIQNEQAAVDFYTQLAKNARNEDMKRSFEWMAQEEIGHKARLTKIKLEKVFVVKPENITDLKIADYVDNVQANPDMSYQEALIVAMKREKAAFRLYTKLASKTDNDDLRNMFLTLAQEESKHKLLFEIEYDEYVLREN